MSIKQYGGFTVVTSYNDFGENNAHGYYIDLPELRQTVCLDGEYFDALSASKALQGKVDKRIKEIMDIIKEEV